MGRILIAIEIQWEREWFPQVSRLYWQSMENRRKFLDELAIKCNIKKLSDWGKITVVQIRQFGGAGLLNYYNDSLFDCLQSVYKETKWKREWFSNLPRFSREHWNSLENCRRFMDEIAINSNIFSKNDWRKVSLTLIRNSGGKGLLHKFQGSMQSILCALYSIEQSEKNSVVSSESILKQTLLSLFPEMLVMFNRRSNKK